LIRKSYVWTDQMRIVFSRVLLNSYWEIIYQTEILMLFDTSEPKLVCLQPMQINEPSINKHFSHRTTN
jgi:hypothetical protein